MVRSSVFPKSSCLLEFVRTVCVNSMCVGIVPSDLCAVEYYVLVFFSLDYYRLFEDLRQFSLDRSYSRWMLHHIVIYTNWTYYILCRKCCASLFIASVLSMTNYIASGRCYLPLALLSPSLGDRISFYLSGFCYTMMTFLRKKSFDVRSPSSSIFRHS